MVLKLYYRVIKMLFKKRYDLCYLTINSAGPGFYKEMIIVFILKFFRKKIVYHYHNKGIHKNSEKLLNSLLYKIQFKNARAILLSQGLFYDVSKYLKPEQVYFCNNGIPGIRSLSIKKNAEKHEPVRLLYVSNMFLSKGAYVLLEACRILAEKKVSFICNFVGAWTTEISEKDFNDTCVKLGLADYVKAHGSKFNDEKTKYFTESDIFVFPSTNEAFPLVNLEAMQCELPVIATNEGAIPEIIIDGYNGFIVPKKDPVALADKILVLINDEAMRKEMGLKGKQRFEEFYTLSKFEQNFTNTMQQVITDFKN